MSSPRDEREAAAAELLRQCEACGSRLLYVRVRGEGSGSFLQRTCAECGSVGPFVPTGLESEA